MQKSRKSSKKVCNQIFSVLISLEVLGQLLARELGLLLAMFYRGLRSMENNIVYVSINQQVQCNLILLELLKSDSSLTYSFDSSLLFAYKTIAL